MQMSVKNGEKTFCFQGTKREWDEMRDEFDTWVISLNRR